MSVAPKLSKEVKISMVLMSVVLGFSLAFLFPKHEEFVATGDVVSVEELGIRGSVFFTYVNSGVTTNLFEKLAFQNSYPDVEFTPISPLEYAYYNEQLEEMESYKEDAIFNAVSLSVPEESSESNILYSRVSEILEHSSLYSGDSFGLMVAIGLFEEWNGRDYSRNQSLLIAGTGTINSDYTVGEVGAIRHKLLTAEQNQVDIFFVPKHREYYGETKSNQLEAFEVVEKEDLSLNVIPVATLDEAIDYLENLYRKKGG
ncbi:hypothetical protein [Halalkalibacter urbisdiaboli]|uniref:hypothetical protein n=1 Tax=Halalkalibacter urbisdiaboli TaxID=1960589 RepID=UPI000B4409D9|nr:hypothetical protein [Halalkalibacter urbisdiaboli]